MAESKEMLRKHRLLRGQCKATITRIETFVNDPISFASATVDILEARKDKLISALKSYETVQLDILSIEENDCEQNMKPVYARLVPFAAVVGANFINIPMMRSQELSSGTPVFTADGKKVGESVNAARSGIALVCVSRVLMAVPGMTLTPLITNYATRRGLFCKSPSLVVPFQLGLVGLCVSFATPLACALFNQTSSLSVDSLEPHLKEKVKSIDPKAKEVYFNKGL